MIATNKGYVNEYQVWRKRAGFNQDDAAEQLYMSKRTLQKFESGERIPSDDVVDLMAEVYGSPGLARWHFETHNPLSKRLLPKITLPQTQEAMALQLIVAQEDFTPNVAVVKQFVCGDEGKRNDFYEALERLEEVISKAYSAILFAKEAM